MEVDAYNKPDIFTHQLRAIAFIIKCVKIFARRLVSET